MSKQLRKNFSDEEHSYRRAGVYALVVHLAIIIGLTLQVQPARLPAAATGTIINAVMLSNREVQQLLKSNSTMNPPAKQPKINQPVPQTKDPTPTLPPPKKEQRKSVTNLPNWHEQLLKERTREVTELKRERQKHQRQLGEKQHQQFSQLMVDEVASELQQLTANSSAEQNSQFTQAVQQQGSLIAQAISSHWMKPEGATTNDFCKLAITLAPGGVVLESKILRSSGNAALERSAVAAVLKASPLPVAEDLKVFDETRNLIILFRADGVSQN